MRLYYVGNLYKKHNIEHNLPIHSYSPLPSHIPPPVSTFYFAGSAASAFNLHIHTQFYASM